MLEMIKPDWPAPSHIQAFATTRLGGVSQGHYASLNLTKSVGDNIDDVIQNRRLLREALSLPDEPLWLHQVHGNEILHKTESILPSTNADGCFTTLKNQVCIITTADCLPILLTNPQGNIVAALHAGWRGLAGNIIGKGVMQCQKALKDCQETYSKQMDFRRDAKRGRRQECTQKYMTAATEFCNKAENPFAKSISHASDSPLIAWLGPAIGQENYEVSQEVKDIFERVDQEAVDAFKPSVNGRWLANLYYLAKQRLKKVGVEAIYGGEFDTFSDEKRFFSYRRNKITGRMATLIWIS